MLVSFADVCCASMPAHELPGLAAVRALAGVVVHRQDARVWVRWESGDTAIVRRLLPIPGVALYAWRAGRWYPFGKVMPEFDGPPDVDFEPLHRALVPAAVQPVRAADVKVTPVCLGLCRDERPRPATGLLVAAEALLAWTETAPSSRLVRLRCARKGHAVLVLGTRLPALAQGQRLWGAKVLVPLGYRLEPDLPESMVRAALNLSDRELLLAKEEGVEAVPMDALEPLERAGLRRVVGEVAR